MDTDKDSDHDILGTKKLNYDFLMLVRDKKYPEALALGQKILANDPNNPSVKKFCDFILGHNKQLEKMVKEEEEYEEVGSDEEDEEEDEEEAEGEDEGEKKEEESDDKTSEDKSQKSDEEQSQQEEEKPAQKPKPKIELRTCTLNQIPHICTRDHN